MADLEDNLETLFLLEVLVDSVSFAEPSGDDLKETCVGFQFLKYPPIIVCEEDFVYMGDDEFGKSNVVVFKSGKSLLFALPALQKDDFSSLRNVHVWVTRRVGRTDATKTMGSTDISLAGSFENLLKASSSVQQANSPVSKFVRGTYPLQSEGREVGTLTAFLRVSSFGKLIVTEFEVKGKDGFNFKGGPKPDLSEGRGSPSGGPGTTASPGQGMFPPQGTPGQGMFPPQGTPGQGMFPPQGTPGQGMFQGPGAFLGQGQPMNAGWEAQVPAMYGPGYGVQGMSPQPMPGTPAMVPMGYNTGAPGPYGQPGTMPCGMGQPWNSPGQPWNTPGQPWNSQMGPASCRSYTNSCPTDRNIQVDPQELESSYGGKLPTEKSAKGKQSAKRKPNATPKSKPNK